MVRKQILIVMVLVTLSGAWLLGQGQAKAETTRQSSNPSIVERIDNFGQNLMGGIFSRKPKSTYAVRRQDEDFNAGMAPRAGSAIGRQPIQSTTPRRASNQPKQSKELFPLGLEDLIPGTGQSRPGTSVGLSKRRTSSPQPIAPSYEEYPTMSEVVGRQSKPTRASSNQSMARAEHQSIKPAVTQRAASSMPVPGGGVLVRNTTIPNNQPTPEVASASQASESQPQMEPLHERLERFRKSVFGKGTTKTQEPALERSVPVQQPTRATMPSLTQQTPTRAPTRVVDPQIVESRTPRIASRPRPTEQTPKTVIQAPRVNLPTAAKRADDRVLLARKSPILNVRTLGPARIAVGKNSTYEVHIENLGEVAADGVVVTIELPEWADVAGHEASSGAILSERSPGGGEKLFWKIGPMEAKVRQKATLGIIPRQSRPIDLAVRWDFTPIASQTVIEVEEPKLSMRLGGPREVKFGEAQLFKLEITNSGNGAAEDVVLTMMPLVAGDGGPTQHRLGNLAAGAQKVIDMELTARQSGTLAVQMELRCDGPAKASLNESLLVRKPNVELVIDAPKMQFTGTEATYRIHVRNSGNATANKVRLTAKIPPEAKLIAANQQGKAAADGKWVEWTIDQLAEGAERELTLKCRLGREGYAQLKAEVLGKRIAANATAVTRVESIADLALSVDDPSGPVPLGNKASYTITIQNRGTKDASGVEAVVYFSQGIEPVVAEGAGYKLKPGQVVFDSIGLVPAGKKVMLKVVAKAQTPGNHMFRAEVYCRPLGTKLVSEETTHFYQGDGLNMAPSGPRTMLGRGTPPSTENPTRTADQRNAPVGPMPVPVPNEIPAEPVEPTEPAPMRY